jgi:hypothetical protein
MKVTLEIDVDYNDIRKFVCLVQGEIWDDEKIKSVVGEEPIKVDSTILEDKKDEMQTLFASLVIIKSSKE